MQQPPDQGRGQGISLDAIRYMIEDKVCEAVDNVANRIPNGQQYKEQFRQAISGAMDNLQQQAQSKMSNLGGMMGNLGGMMGKRPDQQDNPPVH